VADSTGDFMIDLESMGVLIVDDNDGMCKSIRNMLNVMNYGSTYHIASNGLEAWNILQEKKVDLSIIDWNMPLMSGVELLSRIREDKDLRDMPVVMVTGEAHREIVAEAAEADVDNYLLKPFSLKILGERVDRVIEKANNPSPMFYHLKMARDFEEDGNFEAAIEEIKHAMELDSESTRPLRELGRVYIQRDDLKEAEKWLKQAITTNKLDAIAYHHLGELHVKDGNIEKAAKYFDEAMNISPRHVSRGVQFGQALVKNGMIQRAKGVFDRAVELSDCSLALQEEIADFCMTEGVNDYAVKLMEVILDHLPNRDDIVFKLGETHEKLGNPAKALDYFSAAGKKDKDNVEIQLKIAKNYIDTGQMIRAEQILDLILKKDPENTEAQELLKHSL
jgi:DNA-binding response OmpR family regulator/Tfp pilus assembly protein PilF